MYYRWQPDNQIWIVEMVSLGVQSKSILFSDKICLFFFFPNAGAGGEMSWQIISVIHFAKQLEASHTTGGQDVVNPSWQAFMAGGQLMWCCENKVTCCVATLSGWSKPTGNRSRRVAERVKVQLSGPFGKIKAGEVNKCRSEIPQELPPSKALNPNCWSGEA